MISRFVIAIFAAITVPHVFLWQYFFINFPLHFDVVSDSFACNSKSSNSGTTARLGRTDCFWRIRYSVTAFASLKTHPGDRCGYRLWSGILTSVTA